LEKSEIAREGTDVSIFTYSRMRYVVMQAVAELEKKGYNPEVGGRDRGSSESQSGELPSSRLPHSLCTGD
jgi:hypothetical protein